MSEIVTRPALYRESVVGCNLALPLRLLLALGIGALASCKPSEPPPATPTGPLGATTRYTTAQVSGARELSLLEVDPRSETFRALMPKGPPERRSRPAAQARHNLWSNPSRAAELTRVMDPARLSNVGGEALAALLAALPEERRALGLAGLTYDELYGNDGVGNCDRVMVDTEHVHEGTTYEARYTFDLGSPITRPRPALYALSSTCTAALASATGPATAVGAGCSTEDEAAHFPRGSPCRLCLNQDGDHARCLAEQQCPAQAVRVLEAVEGGRREFLDVLEATELSCAPDHVSTVLFLAHDLGPGDPVPAPFDHTKYARSCSYMWNTAAGEPRLFCSPPRAEIRMTISDVVIGRVEYIRLPGETRKPLFHRTMFTRGMELDGVTYDALALHPGSLAELSEIDIRFGGYGMNPNTLRADGTDETNIDHMRARDWLGTMAVKTTTNLDNVPFVIYNKNTCPAGNWKGPDAKGRYFCKPGFFDDETNPNPENYEWQYDYGAFYTGLEPTRMEMLPTVTLGATGRIDETIPGGLVPRVLGTPVLADPQWESCAWPEQFEPDEVAANDVGGPGTYTFTAQTYRFGKDPQVDLRVVLGTSWRRHFCPEPL